MKKLIKILSASVLIASGFMFLTLIDSTHLFTAAFFLFASVVFVFLGVFIGVDCCD